MIIKLVSELMGSHVHSRVFVGEQQGSLATSGELVLRMEEWVVLRDVLQVGALREGVEVVLERVAGIDK